MNQFAADEGGFNPDDYAVVVTAVTALDEQIGREMSRRSPVQPPERRDISA